MPKLGRLESAPNEELKKAKAMKKDQIMNKRNLRQSAFFNLSVSIGLVVFLGGVFLAPLGFSAFSETSAAAPLSGPDPLIAKVTQIRGADGTGSCGGGYGLGVGLVDLDHGLAAGSTTYDHGGFLWCETYAPYLWSEQDGTSTLFELQGDFNWRRSTYIPSGMTPDGSKVVGGVIFFDRGTNAPWTWTGNGGPVEFLKLPEGYSGGNAVAVSNDGRLIAGNSRGPSRVGVSRAAVWRDGSPEILPSTQLWSAVGGNPFEVNVAYTARRTHPMTDDGSVIVGAAGAAFLVGCKATKWVNGLEQQLSTGGVEAQSSIAVFVANSGVIFGYAVLSDGRVVLVRWDADGNPEMFQPPNDLSVVNLSSVDSQGNAAGGALAQQFRCIQQCEDPLCKRKPFVWTRRGGFTILPENGLEDTYNTSAVLDVSDDGRVAVGQLSTCEVRPDSPPQQAFTWSAASGLVLVDDLMAAYGQPDPHYYLATDVSRNGNRVLVVGNPPLTDARDTADLTLDLAWPTPIPKPRRTPPPYLSRSHVIGSVTPGVPSESLR
jgi:uncharacterized membrane protein